MGDVISFERGKSIRTGSVSRQSLCPLCDQQVGEARVTPGGFTFVCENTEHKSFTWTEPAHDALGMIQE